MAQKVLVKRLEELKIRGRVETIQTTASLRVAGIFRRVLETCHSDFSEKPSVKTGGKNLQGIK